MTSTARRTAELYVEAVNAADAARLLQLFAPDAELNHPTGAYRGRDAIRNFYEGLVFAGQARVEIVRILSEGPVAMVEMSATSPLGPDVRYAADTFVLDSEGLIARLNIYYR